MKTEQEFYYKAVDFTTGYLQLKNLYNKEFRIWLEDNIKTAYCGKVEYKCKIFSALYLFKYYKKQ